MADDATEIFTQFRKENRDKKVPFGPEKKKPLGKSPGGPAATAKPADSRAFEPQAPGVAGTGDGSFDKALMDAQRRLGSDQSSAARVPPGSVADARQLMAGDLAGARGRHAATEQLTADIHDMRRQLPTEAPRVATPHTAPARAPVQLPSGMTAPLRPGLDSVISRADQLLGGSITRAAPNLAGVQQLAADLQQTNRNDPTAFRRPGLTPNLAGFSPADQELRAWQEAPGHNTLTPDAFRNQLAVDFSGVSSGTADQDMLARFNSLDAKRRGQDQYLENVARRTGSRPDLQANALNYDLNRSTQLASRKQAVSDRAHDRATARFQAMTHQNQEGGGVAHSQYDPLTSFMLGAAFGGPEMGARLALGASEANQHASDAQRFRDQFNAQMGAQQGQLAEQSRHNRANEGISQSEVNERTAQRQADAPFRDPLYVSAKVFEQTNPDLSRKFMQAWMMKHGSGNVPVVPVNLPNGQPGNPNAVGAPVDLFGDSGESDIQNGRLTDAAYERMRGMHPSNIAPWLDFLAPEDVKRFGMYSHFQKLFPDVPPAVMRRLTDQYYDRFYNTAPIAN